jgi:hypothetical protein
MKQRSFCVRARSGDWTRIMRAASEDEVLTLLDIERLHPVLAALYPGAFSVEEVEAREAPLSAATVASLMCESSLPFAWARSEGAGSAAGGGTPDEVIVRFFNLLEAALRGGNERLSDLGGRVEAALEAAAHALGRHLSLLDAALAGEAAFAFARGQDEEAWREAERALTGAAPDPQLPWPESPNRLEQAVTNLRATGLWPW